MQNFRITAFDRPGLGRSDLLRRKGASPSAQALHLAQAADQLGIRKAVIVGHSYGGAVALAWALERPDQAAALASICGVALPWEGGLGLWYSVMGTPGIAQLAALMIEQFAPQNRVQAAIEAIFAPDPVPDGYTAHVTPELSLRRSAMLENARQVNGLLAHIRQMETQYDQLSLPVEILHGDADTAVPLAVHSAPLAARMPSAHLTVLPSVGHMPHHADPDAAIAVIQQAAHRAGLPLAAKLG